METSFLGKESTFTGGTKYWEIKWVRYKGQEFKVGSKVLYYEEDTQETFKGLIDWMIFTENGEVEATFNNEIGRVNIKQLKLNTIK